MVTKHKRNRENQIRKLAIIYQVYDIDMVTH